MQPELGAVANVVIKEAAATQHLKHRALGGAAQHEITSGSRGLTTRGFDQLDEGQIGFSDAADVLNDGLFLQKSRAKLQVSFINI